MTRLLVIIGFATAFAAGFVVGREHRSKPPVPTTRPSRHGWLANELNLTPEQQKQLRAIWSTMEPGDGGSREDRRPLLTEERDKAIAGLVRPEDRSRYESILQDYAEKTAALKRERQAAFQAAVDRTKQILNPEQRKRYEELLQRHSSDRDQRDHRHPDRDGSTESRTSDGPRSTQPASNPVRE
jgi:Spy/CpxP family protein refolding chaperone